MAKEQHWATRLPSGNASTHCANFIIAQRQAGQRARRSGASEQRLRLTASAYLYHNNTTENLFNLQCATYRAKHNRWVIKLALGQLFAHFTLSQMKHCTTPPTMPATLTFIIARRNSTGQRARRSGASEQRLLLTASDNLYHNNTTENLFQLAMGYIPSKTQPLGYKTCPRAAFYHLAFDTC